METGRFKQVLSNAVPFLILSILSLPIVIGYFWLFLSSISVRTEGLLPASGITFKNWRFLWEGLAQYPSIYQVIGNTLMVAVPLAILEVTISSMAGYALSRLSFPGRRFFLSATLILHAFPSITLLVGIYYVLRRLGLYDNVLGVAMVQTALALPLGIWLMKGFFDNVSWDLEMAALIDGCSRFQTWWRVVMPVIRPGLAALGIFAFLDGWGAYIIPRTFLLSSKNWTISVLLNAFTGDFKFVNYGMVAAVSLFQLIPVLLIYAFMQQYLLNLYAGGVKG